MKVIKEASKKVSYIGQIERAKKMVKKNDIVEQMEREWPEMTQEFKKIQREQYELFLHKQHDYGPGNISVGTQLLTEDEVHLSLTVLAPFITTKSGSNVASSSSVGRMNMFLTKCACHATSVIIRTLKRVSGLAPQ